MDTKLAQHFTYGKLLKFVFPSIVMMVFTSIYCVVDGLFVSNFVGKTAFASINLIMPFIMGLTALGFMMGTGGSAIVAKTLGEGKPEKANEYFSLLFLHCNFLCLRPFSNVFSVYTTDSNIICLLIQFLNCNFNVCCIIVYP